MGFNEDREIYQGSQLFYRTEVSTKLAIPFITSSENHKSIFELAMRQGWWMDPGERLC